MSHLTRHLDEFCRSSGSETGLTRPIGKCRHVTQALATVAWFRSIERRLGPFERHSDFERRIGELLPHLYQGKEAASGDPRLKRWRTYRAGRHVPKPDVVAALDAFVPASASVLEHVLFLAADARQDASRMQAGWRARLPPPHQFALLVSELLWDSAAELRSINLEYFLLAPALDSLATCLIATRVAIAEERHDLAFLNATRLAKALVLSWDTLDQIGIARPFVEYLGVSLFAKARSTIGWSLDVSCAAIEAGSRQAAKASTPTGGEALCRQDVPLAWGQILESMPDSANGFTCVPVVGDDGKRVGSAEATRVLAELQRPPQKSADQERLLGAAEFLQLFHNVLHAKEGRQ